MRFVSRRPTGLAPLLTLMLAMAPLTSCSDDEGATTADTGDNDTGGDFTFSTTAAATYDRVDRAGMPAINTAVITSKDDYNAADPADDAAGDFVDEITANLQALHGALDDDLAGFGLASCATGDDPVDVSSCVAVAAPLVVPDTLKIDTSGAAGFPNGRLLADPVIDVTLAVVLLDLSTPGDCGGSDCTATTLASLPLNPAENDVAFSDDFPYLAAPNE